MLGLHVLTCAVRCGSSPTGEFDFSTLDCFFFFWNCTVTLSILSSFPFSFAGVRPASWFEGYPHLLLVPSLHCSEVFPKQISCISKPGCNICFLEDLKLYMGHIKSLCLNPS